MYAVRAPIAKGSRVADAYQRRRVVAGQIDAFGSEHLAFFGEIRQ
ncbi:hypothetical protein [Verminephrobacter aporrectodeae]|nr:hypothetical protein [Verminephrobacter aporrectodeae]